MKIFLDDFRNPIDCVKYMHTRIGNKNPIYLEGEWFVVRDYVQFVNAINRFKEEITHISFDNDLVDEHYMFLLKSQEQWEEYHSTDHIETGYDCLKYTLQVYDKEKLPEMYFHTMNTLALENMEKLIK
jgi:hypothetical protein